MIYKTYIYTAETTDPYYNLAVEEFFFNHMEPGTCTLYLWQNRHTVVIGRNQNCWGECRVQQLEEDGGHLARRLSGGGAVYHDMGNLNFTFLVSREDYDLDRQLKVIQEAVGSFGVQVEKTGRNDLAVEGRKISGNAFYEAGESCYHHGTILVRSDVDKMTRFLNVSEDKLQSKGVKSVRSRVGNLEEFIPSVTVEEIRASMIQAFTQVYGCEPEILGAKAINPLEIERLEQCYSSWEWKYGRRIPFTHSFTQRFSWGGIEIRLDVEGGRVQAAEVFSDSLSSSLCRLGNALEGCLYLPDALTAAAGKAMDERKLPVEMKRDILDLLSKNMK